MDEQIVTQLSMGSLVVVIGLSGWPLPYRWNVLRLRGFLRALLPDRVNRAIPKVFGTILIAVGVLVLIGTAVFGRLE